MLGLQDALLSDTPGSKAAAIEFAMHQLAMTCPVFHNEADFQVQLSRCIRHMDMRVAVHREKQFRVSARTKRNKGRVDIWLPDSRVILELKYATSRLEFEHQNELFSLPERSAQDVTCSAFWRDVQRVEYITSNNEADFGVVILLTNDRLLWNPPNKEQSNYDAFRLHENQPPVTGHREVASKASDSVKKDCPAVDLAGTYAPKWAVYRSDPEFKFLAISVQKPVAFNDVHA